MKAYSQDLRERIVKAVEEGKSRREVARVFHVSLSTVKRYLKQRDEEGHLDPKPIPGRPKNKAAALRTGLQAQLQASPDATLEEHCEQWEAREGMKVSTSTMSRALLSLRFTRKKKRSKRAKDKKKSADSGKKKCSGWILCNWSLLMKRGPIPR